MSVKVACDVEGSLQIKFLWSLWKRGLTSKELTGQILKEKRK